MGIVAYRTKRGNAMVEDNRNYTVSGQIMSKPLVTSVSQGFSVNHETVCRGRGCRKVHMMFKKRDIHESHHWIKVENMSVHLQECHFDVVHCVSSMGTLL